MEALEWSKCMLDSNASVSTVSNFEISRNILRNLKMLYI